MMGEIEKKENATLAYQSSSGCLNPRNNKGSILNMSIQGMLYPLFVFNKFERN